MEKNLYILETTFSSLQSIQSMDIDEKIIHAQDF